MKTARSIATLAAAFALSVGLAQAKIPVPPMDEAAKVQAEEKKAKAAEAAKNAAEQLSKAQDRVAENYWKSHANAGKPAEAAKK